MKSKILFITFTTLLTFSFLLVLFHNSRAKAESEILLSPLDSIRFLKAVRDEISLGSYTFGIRAFNYSTKEQSAISLFRGSATQEFLDFLPGFISSETIKIVTSLANLTVKVAKDSFGELIKQVEEATVQEATQIGLDWLLQNQVKTSSGSIEYSYGNYEDKPVKASFQYILIFKEADKDFGNVVIEFYSPDPVDAPAFRGSIGGSVGFVGDSQFTGKIDPFILHVEAKVKRVALGWVVDSATPLKLTVEFPEKVPRLQLAKEWPYPLEEKKREVLNMINTVQQILKVFESFGNQTAERIGGAIDGAKQLVEKMIDLLQLTKRAGAGVTLSSLEETDIQQIQQIQSSVQEIVEETVEETVKETVEEAVKETIIEETVKEPVKETVTIEKKECTANPDMPPVLWSVVFYEIGWMGTAESANNEWITLENLSQGKANLEGWQLFDKDKQIHVLFGAEHTIPGKGSFVLERTDDTSLPSIPADLIYKGALNNTDEALYLFDQNCILRDKVVANPDWPSPTPTPAPSVVEGPSPQPVLIYPKILISEVQIAGETTKDEFVELYNPTNLPVDLAGWSLKRKTSTGSDANLVSASAFTGIIASQGYFLIVPPPNDNGTPNYKGAAAPDFFYSGKTYSIAPDNVVILYNPNGEEVDRIGFGDVSSFSPNPAPNPSSGFSLSRKFMNGLWLYQDSNTNSEEFWIQTPTPKTVNPTSLSTPSQTLIASSSPPPPPPPPPPPAPPPVPTSVVINEIAWAGTKAFASDEWLELYNPTGSLVDLTGWKVKSSDTSGPEITLTGSVSALGFYLIERTNDLPTSVAANLFVSFGNGLSNTSCETLFLYNGQDTLMDQTACKTDGSWPGGSATPDFISLERINASSAGEVSNWASNNLLTHNGTDAGNNIVNGTPKATNSVSLSQTIDPDLRFSEFATVTLTLLGSPYIANSDVAVPAGKTLAVEPGVTVKFKNNVSHFTVEGTLSALGQSAKKIVFTNDTGNTSPWCALKFSPTSASSVLKYVTIDHAGTLASSCANSAAYAIFVDGSSITLENSSITTGNGIRKVYLKNSNSLIDLATFSGASFNADSAAVYIEGGAPTIRNSLFSSNSIGIYNSSAAAGNPVISSNTFTNNTYAVKLNLPAAVLSGNTATNNTYNGTFLEGAVGQNTTLQADTMPYIINSLIIDATKTLTLQAGVIVKFVNTPSTPELLVNGTLLANGTSASKVVFTALDDDTVGGNASDTVVTPHWKWIRFQAGGTGTLQNTVVKFGGNTTNQGALTVESGATLQLQSVEIRDSFFGDSFQNSGLRTDVATTGAVFGSNILFANNKYAMFIVGACPTFTQVTGASFHVNGQSCVF